MNPPMMSPITMSRTPHRRILVPILLVATLVLAACSDDQTAGTDTPGPASGGEPAGDELRIDAVDIAFGDDRYQADAGAVTVSYRQEGEVRHTLLIEKPGGSDVADFELEVDGSTLEDTGTVVIEPGTYLLYCDVPGHRAAGMEAELLVR